MEWWMGLTLGGIGLIAGFLNTLAGGGSLLVLPVLVFAGLDGPVANGTNRIGVVAQNIAAVIGFFRKGYSDIRTSVTLSLCALPGAALGAYVGTKVGGELFNSILGVLMIGLIVLMSFRTKPVAEGQRPRRLLLGHLSMVGIGLYAGFIQAGVGFFLMAALHRIMGLDLIMVNMHKVFIVGVCTVAAIVIFAGEGQIMWLVGLTLAVGNAAGGWIGTHFAVRRGEQAIRVILNVALLLMAVKLLIG